MLKRTIAAAAAGSIVLALTTVSGAAKAPGQEYVGSESCRKCHSTEFKSWMGSYHSKMVRRPADGILKGAVEKWVSDGTSPGPSTGNVTGREYKREDVVYVVGSKWKQRFLVRNDATGGYQFLNKQYNTMSGKWESYGNRNDWDSMCATCHSTGYRLTKYDAAAPVSQRSEWSELNIGCEACHGPGARHIKSKSANDIFTFSGKSKSEQSRVCGYCHVRVENGLYRSAQGNHREDLPAPRVGDSFNPSVDWTAWYPEHVVMPGIQAEDKIDAEYTGDLKGLFIRDDASRAMGANDAAKHHQQYQEFLQSKHYRMDILSCVDCHGGLHAGRKAPKKDARASCSKCHDASFTVEKYMPGTGRTADNLFVRTHTFNRNQTRPGGATIKGEPVYNSK